tara:strand:- start:90 stop:599 length:510 start_codon:yes stop_codon:yes gene_type:complete
MAIYYGTGDSSTRIIGSKTATNSTRTSQPYSYSSAVLLWYPLAYSKQSSTSELHVSAHIIGHGKYCYPHYGTWIQATVSGNSYQKYVGQNYLIGGYHSGGSLIWFVNQIWTPSDLGNNTGSIEFRMYWKSANNSQCRPFGIWNPNSSDDNRAMGQTGSTFTVTEREIDS